MLRVAAIFKLCEKLWMVCGYLNFWEKQCQFSYGEALIWVALKIGVHPSLCIFKYASETAPWTQIHKAPKVKKQLKRVKFP